MGYRLGAIKGTQYLVLGTQTQKPRRMMRWKVLELGSRPRFEAEGRGFVNNE